MSSNNMFYNIYSKKSDDELKAIASSSDYTDDSKLCAISILRERDIKLDDFIELEKIMIEKRETKVANDIAIDKYNTGFDRFVALIIDGFALAVIGWILGLFNRFDSRAIVLLFGFIELAIPYLYNILFHGYCGQTLGKMAMNVKIFNKDEKSPISYKQALLRDIIPLTVLILVQILSFIMNPMEWGFLMYLSFVMMFLLMFWSILEIITMLFDSKKRALHDFIAGTIVLKVNS